MTSLLIWLNRGLGPVDNFSLIANNPRSGGWLIGDLAGRLCLSSGLTVGRGRRSPVRACLKIHAAGPELGVHRDLRLDACRGLALWFVFIDHIAGNTLQWLTLRNYGFSDATEVFVFVSGYTCMLSYGGALDEEGWRAVAARSLRRGLEIYAAFVLLVVGYLVLIWLLAASDHYWDDTNTRFFLQYPGEAWAHVVGLRYTPVNTDILPLFVVLHVMFPALLWLFSRSAVVALAASALLYLLVQIYGWSVPAWPTGEVYFNPLAWQFLFVLGAACAGRARIGKMVLGRSRIPLGFAVLYLGFALVIALSWRIDAFKWLVPDIIERHIYPIDKSSLAPLRLIHFLALAVVVSRLVPSDWPGGLRPWTAAMIRCGEHSLAIYCSSVLLSFLAFAMLHEVSGSLIMQACVSFAGIALLTAEANLLTWEASLDRRRPKLF